MKLTPRQRTHLEILKFGDWMSSYGAGLNMGTLASLERRGLVRAARGVGSIFSPQTAIKWKITDAGKAAILSNR